MHVVGGVGRLQEFEKVLLVAFIFFREECNITCAE